MNNKQFLVTFNVVAAVVAMAINAVVWMILGGANLGATVLLLAVQFIITLAVFRRRRAATAKPYPAS